MDADEHGNKRVFQRLGALNDSGKQQKVCYHWRAGRCNKFPYPYLPRELPGPPPQQHQPFISNGSLSKWPNQGVHDDHSFSGAWRSPKFNPMWGPVHDGGAGNRAQGSGAGNRVFKKIEKLCNYWLQGNCSYGDKCKFLHSWSVGDCFSEFDIAWSASESNKFVWILVTFGVLVHLNGWADLCLLEFRN